MVVVAEELAGLPVAVAVAVAGVVADGRATLVISFS